MEKFITFCKSYLTEILFAAVAVLTLLFTEYSAIHYSGLLAAGNILSVVAVQAVLGTLILKYTDKNSGLQMHYTLWFFYILAFILLISGNYFYFLWTDNAKFELFWVLCIVLAFVTLYFAQPLKASKLQDKVEEVPADDDISDTVTETEEKLPPITQKIETKPKTAPKKREIKSKATQTEPAQKIKIGKEFDLLCMVGNQKIRLPFDKRGLGTPIGIFPFKNKPEYLELDEVENKRHTDPDIDKSRLLDERFCCGRVSKITDRLNAYLKELNKPLLEGSYLADSSYMQGCGWIIGFDNTGDYHGGNVPAKLRYMGRFYGKCKE